MLPSPQNTSRCTKVRAKERFTLCPEFTQRYHSHEFIAEGGNGRVYKVQLKHLSSDLFRAIKCIPIHEEESDMSVEDAKKEALVTMKFAHENVLPVHEVLSVKQSEEISVIIIEMDYMKLGSLADVVTNSEPFEEDILRNILKQVCSALSYIWENFRVLHRDVKTGNILIRRMNLTRNDICVCLSDFGTAKEVLNSSSSWSHSRSSCASTGFIGTIHFAAPEILHFQMTPTQQRQSLPSPYSVKSDIFALGVTMAQLMTGDVSTNYASLSKTQGLVRDDLLKHQRIKYSDTFISLIERMLNKNPEERPSYDDIMNELSQISTRTSIEGQVHPSTTETEEPAEHILPPFDPAYEDAVVNRLFDLFGVSSPTKFREESVRICSGCKHKVKHYVRTLLGHSQISCGCRLARHYYEKHNLPTTEMCPCEMTTDIN
ncbi:hypothetical protein FDP41_013401 [Naegleria fowleri]|uniref:non-specific serine/threonine protein kinase n=1 Tax=Naegleria fowleri TaxID=5763 RepID=A0A6A5BSL5_NAEFO|nr:uncharacterized protein FDP41_013768 [Naegleria fowleri]XP_044564900.1 uncharacterized protein FDP41_013401 [Naegleria fowleri]KAF0980119.1 hypothetical protein FDP41_013768 [Naegleria fowleri]KAF0980187.1 hypothetical protein FDP41_013401 [Naegleria fowleri]CAG4718066.1 unnamed protein product [Naegleria fowleri]